MERGKEPIFKSIEEEAEFWDTHDTEEFADEFEPVEVKFARPLKLLIRSWVLEHLKKTY